MSRAEKRAEALKELAEEFKITPGDQSTTAGEDLAEYLGISVQTVYKQRATGTGPPGHPVGRYVRFKRSDVDAWLEKRKDDWG